MNLKIIPLLIFLSLKTAAAEINESANPRWIGPAHIGNVEQGADGICFFQAWDEQPPYHGVWIRFDATTPVGAAFLSEILLAKSKDLTGLTILFESSTNRNLPIPVDGNSSAYRRLYAIKL